MNILITAGGTSEKIDDVRQITNTATGRLGSLIADRFLESGKTSVTYLCSRNAALPARPHARILRIGDVQSLQKAVENEMRRYPYDAVIHSMAVSDYRVKYSVPSEILAARIAASVENKDFSGEDMTGTIHSALLSAGGGERPGKISSDIEHLFLCLERTPKIIGLFKKLQPKTVLVGFKLLSGAAEPRLLQAAENLMKQNGCDFVLANDQKNIGETHHNAVLLGRDHSLLRLETREQIALAIESRVAWKIKENRKA